MIKGVDNQDVNYIEDGVLKRLEYNFKIIEIIFVSYIYYPYLCLIKYVTYLCAVKEESSEVITNDTAKQTD